MGREREEAGFGDEEVKKENGKEGQNRQQLTTKHERRQRRKAKVAEMKTAGV